MGLLTKLKSLLGLDDDRSQVRRTDTGVTIEREPGESVEPDSEVESAVKGVDTGADEESFETQESDETATDATESTGISESTESVETETAADADTAETGDTVETGDATEDGATAPEIEEAEAGRGEAETSEPEPAAVEDPEMSEESEVSEVSADSVATEESESTPESESAEPDEAAEPSVGEGEPLDDIKGIGPAYAERLQDAGVADVAELANADPDRLAEETDLSSKRISTWKERAQAR